MIRSGRDAYGEELRAHLRKGEEIEIVERDDGYITYNRGITRYFAAYESWSDTEKRAIEHAAGRVLDVGCGAGRVALHLQDRGLPVVGIDNSPGAVAVCRERGVKDVRLLPFERIDSSLGRFDTVVMFGNNFGLFGTPSRARRLLRRLWTLSGTGAAIIAETTDPYGTTNPDHLGYHARNRCRMRLGGQLRIRVRYGSFTGPWFYYLFVSKGELERIVEGTGWTVERYLETEGATYIVILRKIGRT